MNFLSADQFDALKNEHDTIQKWRDVPTGIIYKIEDIEQIKTKKGKATIVSLVDCDDDRIRAWATGVLSEDLKNIENDGTIYIKPLGKKESKQNPGQYYYDYELAVIHPID